MRALAQRTKRTAAGCSGFVAVVGVALLGASVLGTTPVAASERIEANRAQAKLQRMAEVMRSVAYEGVFVYSQDERTETMRVVHGVVDGESREHVSALTGDNLEVYRHGQTVVCVWPESGRVMRGQQPHAPLPGTVARALDSDNDYYRVRAAGRSRIAGREADEIRVEPVDEYRYGLRLWVDRAHGFLLRSDLVTAAGETPERLMFTEIEALDSVAPERFDLTSHLGNTNAGALQAMAGADPMQDPGTGERPDREPMLDPQVPPGFSLVALIDGPSVPGREQAIYSDGVATVSLFVDVGGQSGQLPDFSGQETGALRARSARVGDAAVIAMGSVPEATLEYMLDSLTRE